MCQEFRQDKADMACLCSSVSGTSVGKTWSLGVTGAHIIWFGRLLHSYVWLLLLVIGWARTAPVTQNTYMRLLHVISPHDLVWSSPQHGHWVPRVSTSRENQVDAILILWSKLQIHVTSLWLYHKPAQLKRWKHRSHLLREICQSRSKKIKLNGRYCRHYWKTSRKRKYSEKCWL